MGGLSIYSLLVSFIIMGLVLVALSSSFTDVSNTYDIGMSENVSGFMTSVNQSQNSMLDWVDEKQQSVGENDIDSNLAWISTGVLFIITSPMTLAQTFINLLGAFQNTVAFAIGVDSGEFAFITNALVAIITLTFLYAIIKGLTGKE